MDKYGAVRAVLNDLICNIFGICTQRKSAEGSVELVRAMPNLNLHYAGGGEETDKLIYDLYMYRTGIYGVSCN